MTFIVEPMGHDDKRDTRVGLIGSDIQNSNAPAMHHAAAAMHGLSLTYDLIDTGLMSPAPPLEELLMQAEAEGYAGVNVTFPFEKQVMSFLDEVSIGVQAMDAVNTVVFRAGHRFGYNTRYSGFAASLRYRLPEADLSDVLLLGAGYPGRAVAHALLDAGAERVLIYDTVVLAASDLSAEINAAKSGRAEVVTDLMLATSRATGIVNATPAGETSATDEVIATGLLQERHWVGDVNGNASGNQLLESAQASGCPTLSGEGLAVFCAAHDFELFTGLTADPGRMQTSLA